MIPRTISRDLQITRAPSWRQVDVRVRYGAARLVPLVHAQLHELAIVRMSRFPIESVHEASSLLNEAFFRVSSTQRKFDGCPHFFFAVARAMDEIEHEENRRVSALASGGLRNRLPDEFFANQPGPRDPSQEVMMVDEAIMKLKQNDPRNARVVVLRYFNGLTAEETASVLGVSLATVERKWRRLKAWLHKELV